MKNTRCLLTKMLGTLFILLVAAKAQDAAPTLINYQGKLTDASGAALTNGQYSLTFGLYTNASSTNPVWTETQLVTLAGGAFNVALGSSTPLGTNAFSGPDRYLQTTIVSGPGVNNSQTLLPRQQMASVPYALVAQNATNAASADTAAKLGGQVPGFYMPAGGVIAYGGTNEPAGWLICDGRTVSRNTYSALFAAIGTAHGAGDGATTFHLPDYRGRFLRGYSGASTNDPDRTVRTALASGGATGNSVGSYQGGMFASHSHQVRRTKQLGNAGIYVDWNYAGNGEVELTSGTTGDTGGNETRPVNVYVNYIIKY